LSPDVIAKVVVVAAGAAHACSAPPQKTIPKAAETNNWQGILTCTDTPLPYFSMIVPPAFAG
jgi:hypothetical protein